MIDQCKMKCESLGLSLSVSKSAVTRVGPAFKRDCVKVRLGADEVDASVSQYRTDRLNDQKPPNNDMLSTPTLSSDQRSSENTYVDMSGRFTAISVVNVDVVSELPTGLFTSDIHIFKRGRF